MADISKIKIGTLIYDIKDKLARTIMKGAGANTAGEAGQVPAPPAGANEKYLRGDGTWQTPPNTTYGTASQTANGLMSAGDKQKLDGIAANANNYSHPSTHAASMINQDTTHRFVTDSEKTAWNGKAGTGTASQSANGLMSANDKKKLDGIAANANNYSHPSTHAASMISQDATHRFVTDSEKTAWNGKVNTGDIVNNCTSTATNKPLSAAQGKALWDKYTQLNTDLGRAIKELKFVDVVSSENVKFAAKEMKTLKLPTPAASDIAGFAIIGCVQAWFTGTAFISNVGFLNVLPGGDAYCMNLLDSEQTGKLTARYLYARW